MSQFYSTKSADADIINNLDLLAELDVNVETEQPSYRERIEIERGLSR